MSPATRPAAPCCAWASARTSTVSPSPAAPARSAPSSSSAASHGARCAPGRSGAKRTRPLSFAGIGDHALGHQAVPDEKYDDRADHRRDQSRALVRTVVSDRLTDPGRQERAGDPQERGQDEARRIVRPRRKKARDKTGDEADDNDPKDTHVDPRIAGGAIFARKRWGTLPRRTRKDRCSGTLGWGGGMNYGEGVCHRHDQVFNDQNHRKAAHQGKDEDAAAAALQSHFA